jgi:hypothetical protein
VKFNFYWLKDIEMKRKNRWVWCLCGCVHRLSIWSGSFSGAQKLRDVFKPRFAFQQGNRSWPWNMKLKKILSEWVRFQQAIGGNYFTKNEVLRLENVVWNLTI